MSRAQFLLPQGALLAMVSLLALQGCESTGGGGGGGGEIEGISCPVPSRCSQFYSENEAALRTELLRLFDQLEMASGGGGNARRELVVSQQLEILLNECPKIVLPALIEQMQRPIHELQRMNIAMVLGWYPAGKACSEPPLGTMLVDPVPMVRFSAAGALIDLGVITGAPIAVLAEQALEHPEAHVQAVAIQALSKAAGKTLQDREAALAWYRGSR